MPQWLSDCISSSTIHGLPNAVRATSKSSRIFWTCFFLLAQCVFINHVSKLVSQYISEPTLVEIRPMGYPFVFPDVHICKENPLSGAAMMSDEIRSSPAFKKIFSKAKTLKYFASTFWETFSQKEIYETFGRSIEESVLKSNIDSFDVVPNYMYFYCFRYRTRKKALLSGVPDKLILYSDSTHLNQSNLSQLEQKLLGLTYGFADARKKSKTDFFLYLTPPGEYPHMDAVTVRARAGYRTEITVRMKHQKLLDTSRAPCLNENTVYHFHKSFFGESKIAKFNASFYDCFLSEQYDVFRECSKCSLHLWPLTRPPTTFCYNQTDILLNRNGTFPMNNVRRCVKKATEAALISKLTNLCRKKVSCFKTYYTAQVDTSLWPERGTALSDLRELVKNLITDRNRTYPGWEELFSDAYTEDMARQNFLAVDIAPAETMSTVYKEQFTYNLYNLLSDICGISGFYLGCSLLSIGEFFDLLSEAKRNKKRAFKKGKRDVDVPTSEPKNEDEEVHELNERIRSV